MDFDAILDKWENRRDRSKSSEPGQDRAEQNTVAESHPDRDWLEEYLPDAAVVAAKNKEEKIPVSEGRSIWLRRAHQDVLDLHGLTGNEAREEMARFIRSMRRRGLRKGLVIHGKGLHSADGSVLAPLVRDYLEMSTEVGDFGRAARKDGGSGATWFLLRQRSR